MKVISKILTLNFIIMLIFWSLGQPGNSWSAAKLQQQSENSQVNNQDPLGDKFAKFKNDSLAALLCDKNPPYFTNLYPDSGQQCIDFCSIIKFTVNDDSLTKRNDWDSAGVDTNQIFISIETRFWTKNKADSVRPQKINLADSLYKVDCEYYPDQPYDWSDTVTVHLSATDRSYFKNHAETTYVFYSIRDTIPPVLTPIYPERNATGVPIDTGIVIQGTEIGRGVVLQDIKLWIRGFPVIPDSVVGDPWNFMIYSTQDSIWTYGDTVHVSCTAHDLDENVGTLDYWFVIEPPPDTTSPLIEVIRPRPDTIGVPVNTDIMLYVTDDRSGINLSSIELKIDDQIVLQDDINFIDDGIGDTIRYKPRSLFPYQSKINIYFYVEDSIGNPADTSYFFWTKDSNNVADITPPKIEVIHPKPGATDVAVNTDIVFYIADDYSGLDRTSILFRINDDTTALSESNFINDGVGDTVKYQPPIPFPFGSEVDVDFYISDLAGNSADTSYSFWTEFEPDTIAPWFVDLDPDSADTAVIRDSKVKFSVVDDKSGVDVNSVTVKLERGAYSEQGNSSILEILENGKKIRCEYEPNEKFEFGDTVKVTLTAQDTVQNKGIKEYWFAVADTDTTVIVIDQEGPIVFDHDPEIFGSIDTLESPIQFKVRDTSGVNVLSFIIKIRINDGPDQYLDFIEIVSADSDTVQVKSQPLQFNYNDKVFVDIYAEDKAGNSAANDSTTHYYFTVLEDSEPPRIVLVDPTQLTGLQDSFLVRIEDNLSGIDLDKCEMYLWSRKSTEQKKIDIPAFSKTIQINQVDIEYYPDNPYKYNDILSLKFFLQDGVGNSTTVTLLDTIYTPRLLADLFVLNLISSAGDKVVKPNTSVSLDAYVICVNEDCPDSFAVCYFFDEDDVPFHTVWVQGLTKDEVQLLNTSHMITDGKHKVTVIVDCLPEEGRILEENEYNNSAEVTIVGGNPNLIVRNIFTPNDDGFNDNAEFNFEQFDCENPNLKIFDMHGKKIKEFDVPNDKKFVWKGSDSSGRPLLPGVYLYIFSDRNKAIARGAIVIAR